MVRAQSEAARGCMRGMTHANVGAGNGAERGRRHGGVKKLDKGQDEDRGRTVPGSFSDLERDGVLTDGAKARKPLGLLLQADSGREEDGGELIRQADVEDRLH